MAAPALNVPLDRLSELMVVAPLKLAVPPDTVRVWANAEAPPSVRLPPEMTTFSSAVNWFAASAPTETVMV